VDASTVLFASAKACSNVEQGACCACQGRFVQMKKQIHRRTDWQPGSVHGFTIREPPRRDGAPTESTVGDCPNGGAH
jgi:hypothetical protein